MITRVSIISDRPDYSSVYVSDGIEIVERAGGPPWRTLFRAIVKLKVLQFRRNHHATERKTVDQDPKSTGVPVHRFGLSPAGKILLVLPSDREFPGQRQVLDIRGQSIDQLSSARPLKYIQTAWGAK